MRKLDNQEMIKITGGSVAFTASFINSLLGAGELILELGRNLGSAIRRIYEGNSCSL